MILGNFRLPSTRTPHARKAVAVSVACLVLAAIGCETSRRTTPTTFTTNPTSSDKTSKQIQRLQTTQNPVPIDPTIHVYGPNSTCAFGQQFRPTSVIDPKDRNDRKGVDSGSRGVVEAPAGLIASDGTSVASVELTWTASATPGVSYQVLRGASEGQLENLGQPINATTFADSTALAGVPYLYAVEAVGYGQSSGYSNLATGLRAVDSDGDGIGDSSDGCPNDPAKTAPGMCGCGVADTDSDNDGKPDCTDGCPNDPAKTEPGMCGCGVADTDSDNDGKPDCVDAFPNDPAKTALRAFGCSVADTDSDNGAPVEVLLGSSATLQRTASGGNTLSGVDQQWTSPENGWTYQSRRGVSENDLSDLGPPLSVTEFTDTVAPPGITYFYQVRASSQNTVPATMTTTTSTPFPKVKP